MPLPPAWLLSTLLVAFVPDLSLTFAVGGLMGLCVLAGLLLAVAFLVVFPVLLSG